jgi:hypothetical protein
VVPSRVRTVEGMRLLSFLVPTSFLLAIDNEA